MSPREKSTSPRSHPVMCPASLHGDHGLLPSHPGTQSEMAGSPGTEMSLSSHTGPGSGHGYTGQQTDPTRSFRKLGPAWGCAPSGGGAGEGQCQEHFQTHTASVPPKYRYRRFFTSCVISNPKPSPITTCQEEPNFLSIVSLIILAALWNEGRALEGWEGQRTRRLPLWEAKSWQEKACLLALLSCPGTTTVPQAPSRQGTTQGSPDLPPRQEDGRGGRAGPRLDTESWSAVSGSVPGCSQNCESQAQSALEADCTGNYRHCEASGYLRDTKAVP